MCTDTLLLEDTIEHLDFDTTCNLRWIIRGRDEECGAKAAYAATVMVTVPYCHWRQKFLCQLCFDRLLSLVGSACPKCGEFYYSSSYIIQDITKL